MILQDIKETKRYGHTVGSSFGQHENSIPSHTVCGGFKNTKKLSTEIILHCTPCNGHTSHIIGFPILHDPNPCNSPVLSVCLSVCPVSLCPISLSRGCSGVSKVAGDDAVNRQKVYIFIWKTRQWRVVSLGPGVYIYTTMYCPDFDKL